MHILWRLGQGFVKDIIAQMPDPKPPYNTISSIIRILERKGFVGHKAYGKTHEYFPTVSKIAYAKFTYKRMLGNYFDGSYRRLVSFIAKEEHLSEDELESLLRLLENGKDADTE